MGMKYKITPFVVGSCETSAARLIYLGDPETLLGNINSFFLVQGNDKNILVDVGFTEKFCKKFTDGIKHEENQDPLVQLKSVGINPEDIDDIIITHAHFDHLSDSINEYKNALIHLQKKEYEFTINPPHPWFQQYIDIELLKDLKAQGESRLNLIDGNYELFPGINIIATPGHTAGHQSVIVDTKEGEFCLAGDAILNYISLEKDMAPGFNANLIESMQSLQILQDLLANGTKIIISDDPKMLELF